MNNKTTKKQLPTSFSGNIRTILSVFITGVVVATLFTALTTPGILSGALQENISNPTNIRAHATPEWPTPTSRPKPLIGIVVGHWGDSNDPGAVCSDGLTELEINQDIAVLVQQNLLNEGFEVQLLKEFDSTLDGYTALALVSIHADSCAYINDQATGFKVSPSLNARRPEKTSRLTKCMRSRYASITQLNVHNSVTLDMSSYHAFDEISEETPAVIIETGFMNLDRQILTQQPDLIASGITEGLLCYLYNEDISDP